MIFHGHILDLSAKIKIREKVRISQQCAMDQKFLISEQISALFWMERPYGQPVSQQAVSYIKWRKKIYFCQVENYVSMTLHIFNLCT